jgi:ABC-type transporter Mla subunit MlaD
MKNKDMAQRILAVLFFFGGMILIIGVILLIGKDKGLIEPKFQMTILYRDVGGLVEGAPVRILGVNVGHVARIGFLPEPVDDYRVKVVLNVLSRYRPQLEGRKAEYTIKSEGVLGQKLVEVYIDEDGVPDNLNQPVLGVETVNVDDLALVFSEAAQAFTQTSTRFSEIDIDGLSTSLDDAAKSMSETARQMNAVLNETRFLTIKLKRLMNRFEQKLIDGNLFKVF